MRRVPPNGSTPRHVFLRFQLRSIWVCWGDFNTSYSWEYSRDCESPMKDFLRQSHHPPSMLGQYCHEDTIKDLFKKLYSHIDPNSPIQEIWIVSVWNLFCTFATSLDRDPEWKFQWTQSMCVSSGGSFIYKTITDYICVLKIIM